MQTEVLTPFGLNDTTTTWLMVLVCSFIIMGLWSSLGRTRGMSLSLRGPSVKRVYLGVRVQPTADASRAKTDYQAHIVAMDPRSLTMVSPKFLAKGDKMRLGLDSLPGYPANEGPLEAEVTSTKVLAGEPDTYMISARFLTAATKAGSPLVQYLEQLTRQGRLSNA